MAFQEGMTPEEAWYDGYSDGYTDGQATARVEFQTMLEGLVRNDAS